MVISLGNIVIVTNVGDENYYRLNKTTLMEWMKRKVDHLLENFHCFEMEMLKNKDSRTLAVLDLLADNIPPDLHNELVDSYG